MGPSSSAATAVGTAVVLPDQGDEGDDDRAGGGDRAKSSEGQDGEPSPSHGDYDINSC